MQKDKALHNENNCTCARPPTNVCCSPARLNSFCSLQPATCQNVLPVTKPGIKFACADNRQFDPEKIDNVMPSDDACCSKVG